MTESDTPFDEIKYITQYGLELNAEELFETMRQPVFSDTPGFKGFTPTVEIVDEVEMLDIEPNLLDVIRQTRRPSAFDITAKMNRAQRRDHNRRSGLRSNGKPK